VDLWSVLENQMRLGFTVTATLELDTEIGFEAPLVLEGIFRVGQTASAPDEELSAIDVEIRHRAESEKGQAEE